MNYPSTWETITIGDSLELINGRAFKPTEWVSAGRPIIRIQNLNNPNAAYNYYAGELPEKFLVAKGDLLFAWSGTPGTSFGAHVWKGPEAWLNQHIFKVVFPREVFDKAFLQFAINQNLAQYIGVAHGGAGLAHITKGKFEASSIPLPPLPEQKRIVAKIEELFSELEAGEACLRKAQRQLGVYRQSLLKQAFEGKLTAQWRTQTRTRADWRTVTLESISEDISYGYTASSTQEKVGPQLLRITDIQDNRVNWADVPFCVIEDARKAHYLLKAGDLVFARTGATVGKSFLLRETPPESVFASYLIRVRCLPGNSMEYLALFFQSHTYWSQITEFSSGIGQPNVNGSKLKKLTVPLCSLPEQQEIVRLLDEQFEAIERNERELDAALRRSEALRQAILKKAFTGRLVPQSPADEPATALLARLRAERESSASPSKRRRASAS